MGELYEISDNTFTRSNMLAALGSGLKPLEVAKLKWEAILSGGEDFGSSSCACCETYFNPTDKKACLTVCPLGNGDGCCNGEYGTWIRHQNEEHMHEYISYAIRCEECGRIANDILGIINHLLGNQSTQAPEYRVAGNTAT